MYAVIETGGKQYRVELGTELDVELLDVAPGDDITLDRVLLVADADTSAIGQPLVANASVAAHVVRHDRGEKLISFKYRPKARRRVKKGHRQELTRLLISDIVLGDRSAAEDARAADTEAKGQRARLEEAAARQAAADAALAAKLAKAAGTTSSEAGTTSSEAGTADSEGAAKTGDADKTAPEGTTPARARKAPPSRATATKSPATEAPPNKAQADTKKAATSAAKGSTTKRSPTAKTPAKSESPKATAPKRRRAMSNEDS
jgi:large subunit ribosomal protein L21